MFKKGDRVTIKSTHPEVADYNGVTGTLHQLYGDTNYGCVDIGNKKHVVLKTDDIVFVEHEKIESTSTPSLKVNSIALEKNLKSLLIAWVYCSEFLEGESKQMLKGCIQDLSKAVVDSCSL